MSAQIHNRNSAPPEEQENKIPKYIVNMLAFFDAIGAGPKSHITLTMALVVGHVLLSTILPAILIGEALGGYRYALHAFVMGAALVGDFIGMLTLNRQAPRSSPWVHLAEHGSIKVLEDNFWPLGIFCGIWCFAMFFFAFSYVGHECERRDISPPGPGFYAGYIACNMLWWPFHMVFDCFSLDFMGAGTALEQEKFNERVRDGELNFEEAMMLHKKQHRRHRAVIATLSSILNITTSVFIIASAVCIYDYFVMRFTHWMFLAQFVMVGMSICFVVPLTWGAVNHNQDQLKIIITEMGEIEDNAVDKDKTEKVDAEVGLVRYWSELERTQFLVYLQAAELKVTTYNWPLGEGFVMEMTLLYGSFAFLMWQVTTLSGFKGLSFDLSVA